MTTADTHGSPSRSALVDTNLLVLLIVGDVNVDRIEKFKRTRTYTSEDYALLRRLIAKFSRIVTTPCVLAETSNLLGQLTDPERSGALTELARKVAVMEEQHVRSAEVVKNPAYNRLGLTDAGITVLARQDMVVITDDLV